MGFFLETEGDLIVLAKEHNFNVIGHGCNCFCTMGHGIAVPMKNTFGVNKYDLESVEHEGDYNKLGQIEGRFNLEYSLDVINCYTQYDYKRITGVINVDYEALVMCLKKINHQYKGKHIGLPLIGCGLAGGDWVKVKNYIQQYLKDMDVTIVHLKR